MSRSPEITRAGRGSFFVPRREGLVELTDLDRYRPASHRGGVLGRRVSQGAREGRIKIGALGNIVRQFHLHVVARLLVIALALALPGERPPRRIWRKGERAVAGEEKPERQGVGLASGRRSTTVHGWGREPAITNEAQTFVVDLACRKAKEVGYPHELWLTRCLPSRSRTRPSGGARNPTPRSRHLRNALLRIAPSIGFAPRARAQIWRRLRPLIGGSKTDLINSGESHPSLRTSSLAYS